MSRLKPSSSIAVASGKGGTGKTTIAVNLARILSDRSLAVQYLDCDVEEPNGAVFFHPVFQSRQEVVVEVPQVDRDRCNGCGQCHRFCLYGAIVSIGNQVLTFENLCHSCGGCRRVCPTGALRSKPMSVGRVEQGAAGDIAFVQGILSIGSVRSPAVIRQVKKQMRPDGLCILDAPPGTSCPTVAAVRDTDFVLLVADSTPFGLHDLKLAVQMVRRLNRPFAVVLNRANLGDGRTQAYCRQEGIAILMHLPEDRRIARACCEGHLLMEVLAEYRKPFEQLVEALGL